MLECKLCKEKYNWIYIHTLNGLFCLVLTGKVIWWASTCQSLPGHYRQKHCRCNKRRRLHRYWPRYVSHADLVPPPSTPSLDVKWWLFFVFACLDTLCAVLQRDTLSIRENRLFGAVVRWAEAECYRQQLPPTSENKQKVLGKALPLIRFPLMTVEEFAAGKPCACQAAAVPFYINSAVSKLYLSCSYTTQTTETSLIFFLVQQGLPSLEYCSIGRW